jgi:uncharacterized protein with GYD domain
MKVRPLIMALALAMGVALPALAQEPMHRYIVFFKYTDNAAKAMLENPQDREAQATKVAAAFGGKQEAFYILPAGGGFDGFGIIEFPDDVSVEGYKLFIRAAGNVADFQTFPLMTSAEFKASMEKAKNVKTDYTAPTATKQ